jgi:nitrile hydratase
MSEPAGKPHMHDHDAHIRAVEEDLEYYRAKRLEPRIFFLLRRGAITLYDLMRATAEAVAPAPAADLEARIRALEDGLDEYVRGIGLIASDLVHGVDTVIEDTRKERGDYDDFFRFTKKHRHGSLTEQVDALERDLAEYTAVLRALTQALIDKGLLDAQAMARRRDELARPGVWNGARIVARAWVDPEFKSRLVERGREVVRELGIPPGRLGKLGVVENTETVHNVVVCTLCSCYPHDLLGDTPWWYKHDDYKTRIVADPRRTLQEMFGMRLPPDMEIRVHDSTSDVRYMVLPRRPAGTGEMSEAQLASLVTRDSLIGAAEALASLALAADRGPEPVRRASW